MSLPDLNPKLDRTSVDAYSKDLIAQFDKLYISLYRAGSIESTAQASIVAQMRDYVKVTLYYPETPPKEEIPPR